MGRLVSEDTFMETLNVKPLIKLASKRVTTRSLDAFVFVHGEEINSHVSVQSYNGRWI